jgi:hypothetical protein
MQIREADEVLMFISKSIMVKPNQWRILFASKNEEDKLQETFIKFFCAKSGHDLWMGNKEVTQQRR